MEQRISLSSGLLSLSPLVVFLAFYVTLSIVANDFYAVPITVAFMLTCIYSLFILREKTWAKRFEVITYGASQPGLLLMIWIFILAGAFASTAKQMGAIEATVNLSLSFLPSQFILSGLFLAACFISLSVGTSVGTIAALVPIAANVASQTEQSLPMMIAIVVGGAFFGDNLSFISDTTIMSIGLKNALYVFTNSGQTSGLLCQQPSSHWLSTVSWDLTSALLPTPPPAISFWCSPISLS